jgi:hypothetical protein
VIEIQFDGKPVKKGDLADAMLQQAKEKIAEQIRKEAGSVRDPETGEFPTVLITGSSIDDLRIQVEGSPEVIELVKQRLGLEPDYDDSTADNQEEPEVPHVFLSYASEDKELASKVANALIENGIDTWWDEWCITSGDSLRRKIEEGLDDCTHFIVLLTPKSILKEWVNLEVDAGIMLKANKGVKLIPLRAEGFKARDLPAMLGTMHSPELVDYDNGITQLINDIHGVTRKPPLGKAPVEVQESENTVSNYSPAAEAIARVFVKSSKHAHKLDPQISMVKLMEQTSLTEDDFKDGVYELGGLVGSNFDTYYPEDLLFAEFDQYWQLWNPEEDALKLAADMINDAELPIKPEEIAGLYGWEPRRMNPAVAYLKHRDLINCMEAWGTGDFIGFRIQKTDATRRFVKSRL